MEPLRKDELYNKMDLLKEKSEKIYDSLKFARVAAEDSIKNGTKEEQKKYWAKYYNLSKKYINSIDQIGKMCKDLIKEKLFEKANQIYLEQCELNCILPEKPILKDSTYGEKYFYLKIGKRVLAKIEMELLN